MGSQFRFLFYEGCVQNQWGQSFKILVGDSGTGSPGSITVRMEYLFASQF